MQAILNGIICKRNPPSNYHGSRFVIPDKYRKKDALNKWVDVAHVGPNVREDVRVGDKVFIGDNMGRKFSYEGDDYVLIFDTEPIMRERIGD